MKGRGDGRTPLLSAQSGRTVLAAGIPQSVALEAGQCGLPLARIVTAPDGEADRQEQAQENAKVRRLPPVALLMLGRLARAMSQCEHDRSFLVRALRALGVQPYKSKA